VFKVFDRQNTGQVTIQQVNSYIQKFEESASQAAARAEQAESEKQAQIKE